MEDNYKTCPKILTKQCQRGSVETVYCGFGSQSGSNLHQAFDEKILILAAILIHLPTYDTISVWS